MGVILNGNWVGYDYCLFLDFNLAVRYHVIMKTKRPTFLGPKPGWKQHRHQLDVPLACACCGQTKRIYVCHIDRCATNGEPRNLVPLCDPCRRKSYDPFNVWCFLKDCLSKLPGKPWKNKLHWVSFLVKTYHLIPDECRIVRPKSRLCWKMLFGFEYSNPAAPYRKKR